jgi:hypothetical protein
MNTPDEITEKERRWLCLFLFHKQAFARRPAYGRALCQRYWLAGAELTELGHAVVAKFNIQPDDYQSRK